nr:hypothetical protein [Frankia sp. Cas4]
MAGDLDGLRAAEGQRALDATPQYRVVQWVTGNIGTRALRAVIEHPNLTVAGVYVHTPAKAGRDAGELCGLGPTGVVATHDIDEILALGADCILYMPATCDIDEVCRLLAAGANIVTTRGEFHRADSIDPAVRERVEAACDRGGTSIHSTGSSPGFITEAVPLVLTSIQRRLDNLTISEFADLSQRDSPMRFRCRWTPWRRAGRSRPRGARSGSPPAHWRPTPRPRNG